MRKAETAPKKVLLLLIPALTMGIVAVMPDATPISRACMTLEESKSVAAPVVDHPPIRIEPPSCMTCTMSY